MRGVPTNPVACRQCGQNRGARKDALCSACRISARPNPRKKFVWTPYLDALLRSSYRTVPNRAALSAALDHLQRASSFPRCVILARASELGLYLVQRRSWSKLEMDTLRELAGCRSKSAIAKRLGRTVCSVKAKATSLQLCTRVSDGYSQMDLTELFGVSAQTIRRWTMRNWLTVTNGRVCDDAVIRFLKNHPDQYSLRRVNEEWFKGLIFPRFNMLPLSRANGDRSRSVQQEELGREQFPMATNEREFQCA